MAEIISNTITRIQSQQEKVIEKDSLKLHAIIMAILSTIEMSNTYTFEIRYNNCASQLSSKLSDLLSEKSGKREICTDKNVLDFIGTYELEILSILATNLGNQYKITQHPNVFGLKFEPSTEVKIQVLKLQK